jgi:hypothetical protein
MCYLVNLYETFDNALCLPTSLELKMKTKLKMKMIEKFI